MDAVPGGTAALAGDLASIQETRALAEQANAIGPFQAVIHNAGVFRPSEPRRETVVLAFAVARLWPHVLSNAVDPGWVPTRMGGPSAPGDLEQGAQTQVWLAVSDESGALVSGRYLYHRQPQAAHPAASDIGVQNGLLKACEELTGVRLAAAVDKN